MAFKLEDDFLRLFKDKKIVKKLRLLIGKEFGDVQSFEEELGILFSAEGKGTVEQILEKIQLEDDDSNTEEQFEKGTIYPYDASKADIDIREDSQSVYELVIRKWDQGKLILDPNFQRHFVWKPIQQSQFIESVIMNFPLPALYINKDKSGKLVVVDGRQRLTTLRSFLKNEFRLKGLLALPKLNEKNFQDLVDLDPEFRSKIEDKKLNVYMIQPSVPIEMVYDIFNRINTGGTQLERQEIRNCIYMGKSTRMLSRLAKTDYFKQAIDNGISSLRRKDEEAVLRYLSFQIQDFHNEYSGSLNEFVENAMKMINNMSDKRIEELSREFKRVMKMSREIFGYENFRIPTDNTRGRINLAVLESVSYFISQHTDAFLRKNKNEILLQFHTRLLMDNDYYDAVRYSTGSTVKVHMRFNKALEILNVKS